MLSSLGLRLATYTRQVDMDPELCCSLRQLCAARHDIDAAFCLSSAVSGPMPVTWVLGFTPDSDLLLLLQVIDTQNSSLSNVIEFPPSGRFVVSQLRLPPVWT